MPKDLKSGWDIPVDTLISKRAAIPDGTDLRSRIEVALNIRLPDWEAINAALPVGAKLVKMPGAAIFLGGDGGHQSDKGPGFTAVVSPFFAMEKPISNDEYRQFSVRNPFDKGQYYVGEINPHPEVVGATWGEAKGYAAWWNKKYPVPGMEWRLPYEVEFELMRQVGVPDVFLDAPADELAQWGKRNSALKINFKGSDKYGDWWFCDGEWHEWCEDGYGPYPTGVAINYKGDPFAGNSVTRGATDRFEFHPRRWSVDRGFRLVLAPADYRLQHLIFKNIRTCRVGLEILWSNPWGRLLSPDKFRFERW